MENLKDQIDNAIDDIKVTYERNETHIDAYVTNGEEIGEHIHKLFLDANKELIQALEMNISMVEMSYGDCSASVTGKQILAKLKVGHE